jgi:hypothetical protein
MTQEKKPFLQTVPGTVAAVTAMVTALAGAVPVIMAIRNGNDSPSSASSPTPSATSSPTEASPGEMDTPSAAVLIASPKSLDFGKTLLNVGSPSQTVQLANTGEDSMTLGRIRIIGPASAAFAITEATCEEGQELAPDGTCDVKIRFSSSETGTQAATLVVERQPGEPLEVPLSGTASLL